MNRPESAPLLLGIDLGTSSVKAALYRLDGSLAGEAGIAYPTRRSGPMEEQDPAAWITALRRALGEVLRHGRPSAVAVTGQMTGLLVSDAAGEPIHPFLPWSDRRAEAEAGALAERFGALELYCATGCRAVSSYPAAKLLWIRERRPDVWNRSFAGPPLVLGAREWLLWQLTGRLLTDPSSAGASQLYDLHALAWWQEMLEFLGLGTESLPEVRPGWERSGHTAESAAALGLPTGIPVAVGAGDGPCSSLGAGATEPGDVVISAGTSGVVRALASRPLLHPRAATTCYPLAPGLYAGTGVTSAAGSALEWGARALGLADAAELERVARQAPAGADSLMFVPHLGGARTPTWDAGARGALLGLDLTHTRGHMARAVIEGVALSLARALEALREAGAEPGRILLTGGGSKSQILCATIAGLTGLPTFVSRGGDASLGAAQLAAVAGGFFPDLDAARRAMAPVLEPVVPQSLPPGLLDRYRTLAESAPME